MDETPISAAPRLPDLLVSIIPFVRHLGLTFAEVASGRGVAQLTARPEIANYLGNIHAGATFTLAEAASGAAVVGLVAPILAECSPVTREAAIRYKRPADGTLTAIATTLSAPGHLYECIIRDGRADVSTSVEVRDATDILVAEADIVWYVRRRARKKAQP
jgi:uncharacterized protein (TIGR00369 family)